MQHQILNATHYKLGIESENLAIPVLFEEKIIHATPCFQASDIC